MPWRHWGWATASALLALASSAGCGSDSSSGGHAGTAGSGATGGFGGFGGTGGTAGVAGTAGSAGTAGVAGVAGQGGSADAGVDATGDAASDAGVDAPADATVDAAPEAGVDAGSASRLIVSDGSSNQIFVIALDGSVLDTFTSPVTGPRGVAWDRTKKDGYWVIGTGDGTKIYKLSTAGSPLTPLPLKSTVNANSFRGLDYFADAAGDRLVFIFNNGIVAAVQAVDLTGATQLQSSHYKGGFLSGFWGVHVVANSGVGGDIERWTAWNDGTLQRWVGSQNQAQVITTTLGTLQGLSITPAGEFWVVAGSQIVHLDSAGNTLGSIAAPGSDARGLSYVE